MKKIVLGAIAFYCLDIEAMNPGNIGDTSIRRPTVSFKDMGNPPKSSRFLCTKPRNASYDIQKSCKGFGNFPRSRSYWQYETQDNRLFPINSMPSSRSIETWIMDDDEKGPSEEKMSQLFAEAKSSLYPYKRLNNLVTWRDGLKRLKREPSEEQIQEVFDILIKLDLIGHIDINGGLGSKIAELIKKFGVPPYSNLFSSEMPAIQSWFKYDVNRISNYFGARGIYSGITTITELFPKNDDEKEVAVSEKLKKLEEQHGIWIKVSDGLDSDGAIKSQTVNSNAKTTDDWLSVLTTMAGSDWNKVENIHDGLAILKHTALYLAFLNLQK